MLGSIVEARRSIYSKVRDIKVESVTILSWRGLEQISHKMLSKRGSEIRGLVIRPDQKPRFTHSTPKSIHAATCSSPAASEGGA